MQSKKSHWGMLSSYFPQMDIFPLTDPRWEVMTGGQRKPYDPRPVLLSLEVNAQNPNAWRKLWDELQNNGTVGEASYAAIPHLVRIVDSQGAINWNLFGIACMIEVERHRKTNPPLPSWLQGAYLEAWKTLNAMAKKTLEKPLQTWQFRMLLAVQALAKNDLKLGALLAHTAAFNIDELAEQYFAWSKLYVSAANE